AGPGGNPARVAALAAGLGVRTCGLTVDRQCGSGLEAINLAARLAEAGAGEVYLAGGAESASTALWRLERPRSGTDLPRVTGRARFSPDTVGDPDMGVAAETVARQHGISRERQDRFAADSHRKAAEAAAAGRFDAELVAVRGSRFRPRAAGDGDAGGRTLLDRDKGPRPRLTAEALARFPAAFVDGGTVTVGNSCPLNDGAAVVAVVSERVRRRLDLPGLRVVDAAAAGVDPAVLGIGPVDATRALLARHPELQVGDLDIIEFNEAFAGQVRACLDALGIDETRVNSAGGAVALGHPWGAAGAVLVVRLFTAMVREQDAAVSPPRRGLATLGAAGGMGIATLLEAV
ncbi:MAG: acetyl-CoA C-acyltransferase, partial [Solirubrobacterales bacterium]|nr:acetyl-CoA C-acyltransferase [Solirubrobacterales bacterium]